MRIESVSDNIGANGTGTHVGRDVRVEAVVDLGQLQPQDVIVELYHGILDDEGQIGNGQAVPMAKADGENRRVKYRPHALPAQRHERLHRSRHAPPRLAPRPSRPGAGQVGLSTQEIDFGIRISDFGLKSPWPGETRVLRERRRILADLPLVPTTDAMAALAKNLVRSGLLPGQAGADAMHSNTYS